MTYLHNRPWIRNTVSQITGFASGQVEGDGQAMMLLFGVQPEEYLAMFPHTVEMISGRFLTGDEAGIVLSETVAKNLEESSGHTVKPGMKILLTAQNMVTGTKIRELEVKGIMRFPSEAPNLSLISYIDLSTLRVLAGLTKITDVATDLTKEEQAGLGAVDEENIFGTGETIFTTPAPAAKDSPNINLNNILGDTSAASLYQELDPTAFYVVLLKTDNSRSADEVMGVLNRHFKEAGMPFRAYGWVDAAGGIAQIVSGLKLVFNVLIVIVAIVAVIIIMNTLVISITERIGEIGTMRAIGAQRIFIRGMITLETLVISLVFGLFGICFGFGILAGLGLAGIQASGIFFEVLLGGHVLRPVIYPGRFLPAC